MEREPVIIALWHGEHFLMPYFGWRKDKLNILVTLHRDGEVLVRAGERFGLKFLRGSGDHGPEFMRKRAVQAFTAMLRLLKRGESIVVTADVPKIARVAGLGIVTLAKHSGCPIVPVAMATSRRVRLSNWDRTPVSLPFGRMIMVRGEPIRVPREADEAALEAARRTVEQRLNEVTERAYALADGKPEPCIAVRHSGGSAPRSADVATSPTSKLCAKSCGDVRTPQVERSPPAAGPRLPVLVDRDVVDVAGIFRVAAPRIAHVVEIVGAEHVAAEAPAVGEALVGHVGGADADVVDRADVPEQMMQAGAVRLHERDHVMVAAVDAVHERDQIAGAVATAAGRARRGRTRSSSGCRW